ncbi:hypothetical protein [Aequorivita capsosiphonis]|uniref:hypothetical protein n=1 Tax=Aequorivita capsosiphonis TaxID=487317 RepID=UPI00040B0637|nr:hypothetical protein [Aequorivita capsosiphonis]
MAFLDDYKSALLSETLLEIFIDERLDELYDYYSLSNYEAIIEDKLFFRNLPTYPKISELDFLQTKNEAFLNLLLATAVRLNEPFSFGYFLDILERKNLEKSKIIEASTIFMNCRNATELIDGYIPLLDLLEESFLTQSDGQKEPLTVLLNYYATAVVHFAEFNGIRLYEIRQLLLESYENKSKTFLQDTILKDALGLSIKFEDNPYNELQELIDIYLERNLITVPFVPGYLIESGTAYADLIAANTYNMGEIWELNRELYNNLLYTDSIFKSLGRGTAVLTTEDQLITYMSQLGKMHFAKLKDAFDGLPNDLENIHLFDWGCGQAPASKMFIDRFSSDNIKSVTLIEPSQAALKRASLHVSKDTKVIRTINKDFDSLIDEDIVLTKNAEDITIHIFSNVIDMDYFQLHNLIGLLRRNSSGLTYYILVSPLISTTQTQRLETFLEEVSNEVNNELLLSDNKKSGTWYRGWSKVIRVFKTII